MSQKFVVKEVSMEEKTIILDFAETGSREKIEPLKWPFKFGVKSSGWRYYGDGKGNIIVEKIEEGET